MGFKIHTTDDGRVPGIEYLPCGAITPKIGMALKQTGGNLAAATAAVAPTYISLCERETAVTEGELIPVLRVQPDMIFETEWSEDASTIKLGDKVKINAGDAMSVTATTGGVAEVVNILGTAAGDAVRVRFV